MPGQEVFIFDNGAADGNAGGAQLRFAVPPADTGTPLEKAAVQLAPNSSKTLAAKVFFAIAAALLLSFVIVSCSVAIRALSPRSGSQRWLADTPGPCGGGEKEEGTAGDREGEREGFDQAVQGWDWDWGGGREEPSTERGGDEGAVAMPRRQTESPFDLRLLQSGYYSESDEGEQGDETSAGGSLGEGREGTLGVLEEVQIVIPPATVVEAEGVARQKQVKELVRSALQKCYDLTVRSDVPKGNAHRRLRYLRRGFNNILNIFSALSVEDRGAIYKDTWFVNKCLKTMRAIECQLYSWQSMIAVYDEVLLPRLLRTFVRLNNIREHVFQSQGRTLIQRSERYLQTYVNELQMQQTYAVQLVEGADRLEELKAIALSGSVQDVSEEMGSFEQLTGMRTLLYKALVHPATLTDTLECCIELCIAMVKRGDRALLSKIMTPVLQILTEEQLLGARLNARFSSPTVVAAGLTTVGRLETMLRKSCPHTLPLLEILFEAMKSPVLELSLGEPELMRVIDESCRAARSLMHSVRVLTRWARCTTLRSQFHTVVHQMEEFVVIRRRQRSATLQELSVPSDVRKPTKKACILWNRMQRRYLRIQRTGLKTLQVETAVAQMKFGRVWHPVLQREIEQVGEEMQEGEPRRSSSVEEGAESSLPALSLFISDPVWESSGTVAEQDAARQARAAGEQGPLGFEEALASTRERRSSGEAEGEGQIPSTDSPAASLRARPWRSSDKKFPSWFRELILPFHRVPVAWTLLREETHRRAVEEQYELLLGVEDHQGPFASPRERLRWLHAEVRRLIMPLHRSVQGDGEDASGGGRPSPPLESDDDEQQQDRLRQRAPFSRAFQETALFYRPREASDEGGAAKERDVIPKTRASSHLHVATAVEGAFGLASKESSRRSTRRRQTRERAQHRERSREDEEEEETSVPRLFVRDSGISVTGHQAPFPEAFPHRLPPPSGFDFGSLHPQLLSLPPHSLESQSVPYPQPHSRLLHLQPQSVPHPPQPQSLPHPQPQSLPHPQPQSLPLQLREVPFVTLSEGGTLGGSEWRGLSFPQTPLPGMPPQQWPTVAVYSALPYLNLIPVAFATGPSGAGALPPGASAQDTSLQHVNIRGTQLPPPREEAPRAREKEVSPRAVWPPAPFGVASREPLDEEPEIEEGLFGQVQMGGASGSGGEESLAEALTRLALRGVNESDDETGAPREGWS